MKTPDKTMKKVLELLEQKRAARDSNLKMMADERFDSELDWRTKNLKVYSIEIDILKRIVQETR